MSPSTLDFEKSNVQVVHAKLYSSHQYEQCVVDSKSHLGSLKILYNRP